MLPLSSNQKILLRYYLISTFSILLNISLLETLNFCQIFSWFLFLLLLYFFVRFSVSPLFLFLHILQQQSYLFRRLQLPSSCQQLPSCYFHTSFLGFRFPYLTVYLTFPLIYQNHFKINPTQLNQKSKNHVLIPQPLNSHL